jgi:hypothetical protein
VRTARRVRSGHSPFARHFPVDRDPATATTSSARPPASSFVCQGGRPSRAGRGVPHEHRRLGDLLPCSAGVGLEGSASRLADVPAARRTGAG